MATFTTWADALENLENQLVSTQGRVGSVTVGGKTITYKSNEDFIRLLDYVERKANRETKNYASRTYAKNGGRAKC